MKKILDSRFGVAGIASLVLFINFIFMLILFSLKLEGDSMGSIWSYASLLKGKSYICYFCVAFIIMLGIGVLIYLIFGALSVLLKKKWMFIFPISYQLILSVTILFFHIYSKALSVGALVICIFSILLLTILMLFLIHYFIETEEEEASIETLSVEKIKTYKLFLLAFETVSLIVLFTIFFMPLYTSILNEEKKTYILIQALTSTTYELYIYIIFMVLFLAFLFCSFFYATTISFFLKSDREFINKSRSSVYSNVAITLLYFIVGYFMCFYNNMNKIPATTISYIPFLISLVPLLGFSIIQGKLGSLWKDESNHKEKKFKIEPLIFILILTIITFLSLFFNIIEVKINATIFIKEIQLSGYKLLTTYKTLEGGYQKLSFVLFSFLLASAMLLILSIISYFAKYKDYYKVIKTTAFANVLFMFLIGIFGIYFEIAQKINEENIKSLITAFNISLPEEYTYTVSSQSLYIFFISFAVLIVMLIRGQLNLRTEDPVLKLMTSDDKKKSEGVSQAPLGNQIASYIEFDACPAFTELDSKIEFFEEELKRRREQLFENLTLPNLVRFIVDYARESRLHLFYSSEDIATFIAGLGASRLTILQGMSGTGKTSLPKIFTEAILGNCEIVEVESSWRDKNELLGYYNEFSKCFTPKKFTQCLYKARLNPTIPTFIVLDEMNLSRIEYYFSDFLSLMENEEDKRQIKLLNVKLHRTIDGKDYEYYGLTEGHTLQIPTNVWFIGTANRDESTFEISDKVYDRAQTMNFNKRAQKTNSFSEPLSQRFIPYEQLAKLFDDVKKGYQFDAESNTLIRSVEELLIPYNISFGNRILRQMEDFIKIYCACFGNKKAVLKDAIERILFSKVVSKLEFKIVENKEALAIEFDKLGLGLCSAFVRKLNED
ncbi:MAG: hypothetical protein K2N64_00820 [Anaeroplasmataceae bacterium]|nr:hypothetical protein [Anaeroplasmataceae bacterium]